MLEATIAAHGCRIVVSVSGYERASAEDYHDANWLDGAVAVELDGYRARQAVSWQAAELLAFADDLDRLGRDLTGTAQLTHLEDEVALRIALDHGRGELEGVVRRPARAALTFEGVEIDQTQVGVAARELRAILRAFPVRLPGEV